MEPFIGLGLNAANQVIDKHWHKLPDKPFNKDFYVPGRKAHVTPKPRNRNPDNPHDPKDTISVGENSEGEDDCEVESPYELEQEQEREKRRMTQEGIPRYSGDGSPYYPRPPPSSGTPPQYSREPPAFRPKYMPSPPLSQYSAYPPQPQQRYQSPQYAPRRDRRDYYYDESDSDSYRAPRRPKAVTRRSSSYHGPRTRSPEQSQQVARRQRRNSNDSPTGKAKDVAERYKLKDEIDDIFSKTPKGLAGGAVGALVGGWAVQKAQTAYGRDKSKHERSSAVLTILGAAVGGLAVNAVVDKYEESKKDTGEKEQKWEDKFGKDENGDGDGNGSDSDEGRSKRSGKSASSRRSRRDDRDDGRDRRGGGGYTGGYGSDY